MHKITMTLAIVNALPAEMGKKIILHQLLHIIILIM
jgi:hypothetical protein